MGRKRQVEIITAKDKTQNLVYLFLAGKNERSRGTYLYALNKVARHFGAISAYDFDWSKLRNEHTTVIRAWLLKQNKDTTANTTLAAVKGVLEKAYDLEMLSAEDYLRAIKPCNVKVNQKPHPATGRMLTPDEIAALLKTCQTGPRKRGIRDAAIIMLLAGCGLCREEICTLLYSEYDQETGRLIVHGKGGKTRTAYLTNGTKEAMAEWLKLRGSEPGPLFFNVLKVDTIFPRPIAKITIWKMIIDRGQIAGLENFSTHDMRRTFISELLAAGVDISTVSDLAGHTNVDTTKGYDRRGEDRKVDATSLLHIPFEKRGEL